MSETMSGIGTLGKKVQMTKLMEQNKQTTDTQQESVEAAKQVMLLLKNKAEKKVKVTK
jgi:hypothetical protein